MAKIGRNDPCCCGRGKKYKKCCESKDQQAPRVALTDGRPDGNNFDDYIDSVDDDESMQSGSYPIISAEEEKLVRNWWETYRNMDHDVDVIRPHLDAFLENLGLEHEVIFELAGSCLSQTILPNISGSSPISEKGFLLPINMLRAFTILIS